MPINEQGGAGLTAEQLTSLTGQKPYKYDATTPPGVTNDIDDSANASNGVGFEIGSVWIDTTGNEAYRCVDNADGAAIWINTTLTTDELGTFALLNNPMTTAGDIITGGASGTPTRLGIGSALQTLRVNAGATALEFADPAGGGGVTWQTLTSSLNPAVVNNGYAIDASSNTVTITLPATPTAGDVIEAYVEDATFTVTFDRNTKNINGSASNITGTEGTSYRFVYVDATTGWRNTQTVNTTVATGSILTVATRTTAFGVAVSVGDLIAIEESPPIIVRAKTTGTSGENLTNIEYDILGSRSLEYPYSKDIALLDTLGTSLTTVELGASIRKVFDAIQLEDGSVLLAIGGNNLAQIHKTEDFGSTYSVVDLGTAEDFAYCLADLGMGDVLAGTGSGAGEGDVWRSTDYGSSWTQIDLGSTIEEVRSLAYCGNDVALAGTGRGTGDGDIWRSTDRGLTWTKVEMGATLERVLSIKYLGNGVVLAGTGSTAGDGDVWRSTDRGLTWTNTTGIASGSINSIEALGEGVVLAGAG